VGIRCETEGGRAMTRKKHHWALVGFWHGSPCSILHGEYVPPFACWFIVPEDEWQEARDDGRYTRLQSSRPSDLVDTRDQKGAPRTLAETGGRDMSRTTDMLFAMSAALGAASIRVYCHRCGRTESADAHACLTGGWPRCCGETMSMDPPNEKREDAR